MTRRDKQRLAELEETVRRLKAVETTGSLTNVTTRGTTRRPTVRASNSKGGNTVARWA